MSSRTEAPGIRVVVVDDHPILRDGTCSLLEQTPDINVAGVAGDGGTALRLVAELKPDVLLLDLRLPDMSGVAVAEQVRARFPGTHILVLSGYDDAGYMRAMFRLGIGGYLSKTARGPEIVEAVRSVAAGKTVLAGGRTALGSVALLEDDPEPLTSRERQVLRLLAQGRRNQEIADTLGLSIKSIEFHVRHLLSKLQARSRTEAVARARQHGLLLDPAGELS